MGRIDEKFKYKTNPLCNSESVVCGKDYRFTVLTSCLIRMEYSKDGKFEDRATQTVVNRYFDKPEFTVKERDGELKIVTDGIELTYTGGPFTQNSLSAVLRGSRGASTRAWYFGVGCANLMGTARTLDGVNGSCKLNDGILSVANSAVIDDSKSLVIAEDGWVEPRDKDIVDIYLFAYKCSYREALRDFYHLTGKTPMIPRFALGNWWSRYYKYTQESYEELMRSFEEHKIPLSVAVIDMDWHLVDVDPKYGSGWTGFTWNDELFPDHVGFMKFLHDRGMKVTLNLHPAEGIAAHEKCYKRVAERMGVDTETGESVEFDVADPKFIETYFDEVLHPMEKEGVDFWWMDWQQGNTTKIEGLDPLWMLNHYHYLDKKNGNERPMIFSRYSGPGSHRYPIGFSGDTWMNWESLDFQPYFTATASNIGYGWWSHDIGGHMFGIKDDELIARWVQFGVFSPIMRLHSTNNEFQSKEPWIYSADAEKTMTKFMRLRHAMIPYLYTMNYRAWAEDTPLIQPLYHVYPNDAKAYSFKNEYVFGSELIAAPITQKADSVTTMGNTRLYLPEGTWFDFFTNHSYPGGRTYRVYRKMEDMPVFAKAGAIIPLAEYSELNDVSNPKSMRIAVFPGADNSFELYEDDGVSEAYLDGMCARTRFELKWSEKPIFTVCAPEGDSSVITENRSYTVEFRKISDCDNIAVTVDGNKAPFEKKYADGNLYITVNGVCGRVEISFGNTVGITENDYMAEVFDILLRAQSSNRQKAKIYDELKSAKSAEAFAETLEADGLDDIMGMKTDENLRNAILETVLSSRF